MAKIVKGNIEATGQIKGATIVGALTGTADIATEVTVAANNSTDETVYLTFVGGQTGTQGLETDTGLTYNPSTNQISATTSGSIAVQNVTGAGANSHYVPVVNTFNGNSSLFGDANLEFNSSTNTLTTTTFAGALTGDVTGDVTGNVTGDLTGGVSLPSGKTIAGLHETNTISTAGNISVTSSNSAVIAPEVQSGKITHRSSESVLIISSIDDIKMVLDEGTDNSLGTFTIHKNADSNTAVFTVNEDGIATAGGFTTGGSIGATTGNITTVSGNIETGTGQIKGKINCAHSGATRFINIPEDNTTSLTSYYIGVVEANDSTDPDYGKLTYLNSSFFTGTHIYKAASDIAPGTAVELVNGSVQATSSANSAICVGIVAQTQEATAENPIETSLGESLTSGWGIKLASVGDVRHRSTTGFLVCNEGGNIAPGDLLVTSSTAGYLMKQADDIIRATTVGKAMEAPSFDENGQASGIYGYIYCG